MLASHRARPLNVVGRVATVVWSAARDVDGHGCARSTSPPMRLVLNGTPIPCSVGITAAG
jgi:hypothetical protein